jgi:hypothetical protein
VGGRLHAEVDGTVGQFVGVGQPFRRREPLLPGAHEGVVEFDAGVVPDVVVDPRPIRP